MRRARDPRILTADAQGTGRARAREQPHVDNEPNSAEQPLPQPPAPPTPSHLDQPPSDPEMMDPDDSTEFNKVVNEDLEMQQNARELVQEEEETPGDQDMGDDESPDMVALIDAMQVLGVAPLEANRYAKEIVTQHRSARRPTFMELYGVGNAIAMAHGRARDLNLKGLAALDLRTRKPTEAAMGFH